MHVSATLIYLSAVSSLPVPPRFPSAASSLPLLRLLPRMLPRTPFLYRRSTVASETASSPPSTASACRPTPSFPRLRLGGGSNLFFSPLCRLASLALLCRSGPSCPSSERPVVPGLLTAFPACFKICLISPISLKNNLISLRTLKFLIFPDFFKNNLISPHTLKITLFPRLL